jgi:hypothetical protein
MVLLIIKINISRNIGDCACALAVKLEMNLDGAESLSSILLCKCQKVKIHRL